MLGRNAVEWESRRVGKQQALAPLAPPTTRRLRSFCLYELMAQSNNDFSIVVFRSAKETLLSRSERRLWAMPTL